MSTMRAWDSEQVRSELTKAAATPNVDAALRRLILGAVDDASIKKLLREERDGVLDGEGLSAATLLYERADAAVLQTLLGLVDVGPERLKVLRRLAGFSDETLSALLGLGDVGPERLKVLRRFGDVEPGRVPLLARLAHLPDESFIALARLAHVGASRLERISRFARMPEPWLHSVSKAGALPSALIDKLLAIGRRGPQMVESLTALSQVQTPEMLKQAAPILGRATIIEDLCISAATTDWQSESSYLAAYDQAAKISAWGTDVRWRVYTLIQCAKEAALLDGHFVECGVDRGGTAMAVVTALGPDAFKNRRFFLFDTFRGLVADQLTEDEVVLRSQENRFPDVWPLVQSTFAGFDAVQLVRGVLPHSLDQYDGGPIAYLHIDLNAKKPEVETVEALWHLVQPGAPVIFDDYGFPGHREQKQAIDQLGERLGYLVTMLPTGQGLVRKR